MAVGLNHVLKHLRKVTAADGIAQLCDGQLVERCVAEGDEAAFATLVQRHGAMVRSVCRRVLQNDSDADDACQATFLVLARKASSIRKKGSIASWLHGVARRAANNLRKEVMRRRARECRAAAGKSRSKSEVTWREVQTVFVDGRLIVLARGGVGKTGPHVDDLAGFLIGVDPNIYQPYTEDPKRLDPQVKNNGCLIADPKGRTDPKETERPNAPFRLWDQKKGVDDIDTDRPYAGLAYDPKSFSHFVACFSGIDVPEKPAPQGGQPVRLFKKNATDAIHRYYERSGQWFPVERHDPNLVPLAERTKGNKGDECPPGNENCRVSLNSKHYCPGDATCRSSQNPPS